MLVQTWNDLVTLARASGFGARVGVIPDDPTTPLYGSKPRRGDPAETALMSLLPADYRTFVAEAGYVAAHFGDDAQLAFLPPRVMRQVTGAMGDSERPFAETRKLREQGVYEWRFAFFAGVELADVNGWCFVPGRAGDIVVRRVEDSLPIEEPLGAFGAWLESEIARLAKIIDSPAKATRRLREFRENAELEDGEPLPKVSLASFGA